MRNPTSATRERLKEEHMPWKTKRGKLCLSVEDAKGYPVAIVHERPDQKANASLIAAAPELLVALEKALCAYKGDWQRGGGWEDETRAAIKKARGGRP